MKWFFKNADEKKVIAAAREAIEDSRKPKPKPPVTNSYKSYGSKAPAARPTAGK